MPKTDQPKAVKRLDVILCTGKPGQGKSTLASALNLLASTSKVNGARRPAARPTASSLYQLDRSYMAFVRSQSGAARRPGVGVGAHFKEASRAERDAYWEFLAKELRDFARTTLFTLVIEGAIGAEYADRIEKLFPRARFTHIELTAGGFEHKGRRFQGFARRSKLGPVKDHSFDYYKLAFPAAVATAAEFAVHLRDLAIRDLVPETRYQCFDDLGMAVKDSDSPAKYAAFELDRVGIKRTGRAKRVLDVGCQSGNFSIRMARTSRSFQVTGIDVNKKPLDLAARYNAFVYQLANLSFVHSSFMDYTESGFDLILAASVFHYFREGQQDFLDRVYEKLNPGGVLVLECGLSELEPDRPYVELHARKVDGDLPCHFPNRRKLDEMVRRFELRYERPSIRQGGDPHPRYVLHLEKATRS
jgi:SAM-dependent methyltransferase